LRSNVVVVVVFVFGGGFHAAQEEQVSGLVHTMLVEVEDIILLVSLFELVEYEYVCVEDQKSWDQFLNRSSLSCVALRTLNCNHTRYTLPGFFFSPTFS
jgi:hypothetical protein